MRDGVPAAAAGQLPAFTLDLDTPIQRSLTAGAVKTPTLTRMDNWNGWLVRWADAGLIDAATAQQIRAYETGHAGTAGFRWPILIALAFGGLMLGGGVLLFVAAHWAALSPGQRFGLVLLLVAGCHVAGALIGDRFQGLSTALHAVGTVALGGGIALAGQIFNLAEHWPAAILMWAVGAAAGWSLLRQMPQLALLALLGPGWLVSEWIVAVGRISEASDIRIASAGVFLCALSYLTAVRGPTPSAWRRALQWIGGLALLPAAVSLAAASSGGMWRSESLAARPVLYAIGWTVAIGLPLALAVVLRRRDALLHGLAAAWTIALAAMWPAFGSLALYGWWALGAIGLVSWGIRDGRVERVNLGAALFAATVGAFYFSEVMDKLGRSGSLIGLGLLFLVGGWALERARRRLALEAREAM